MWHRCGPVIRTCSPWHTACRPEAGQNWYVDTLQLDVLCVTTLTRGCSIIDLGSSRKTRKRRSKSRSVTPKLQSRMSCSDSRARRNRGCRIWGSCLPSRISKLQLVSWSLRASLLVLMPKLSSLLLPLMIREIPQPPHKYPKATPTRRGIMTRWWRQMRTR